MKYMLPLMVKIFKSNYLDYKCYIVIVSVFFKLHNYIKMYQTTL